MLKGRRWRILSIIYLFVQNQHPRCYTHCLLTQDEASVVHIICIYCQFTYQRNQHLTSEMKPKFGNGRSTVYKSNSLHFHWLGSPVLVQIKGTLKALATSRPQSPVLLAFLRPHLSFLSPSTNGSGSSTTLYSCLHAVPCSNIYKTCVLTVRQCARAGFTFSFVK